MCHPQIQSLEEHCCYLCYHKLIIGWRHGKLEMHIEREIKNVITKMFRGCLSCVFKQPFSVFKQHFMHSYILFHPHVFSQIFSNNNFQFLNTCTKRTLSVILGFNLRMKVQLNGFSLSLLFFSPNPPPLIQVLLGFI